MGPHYSPDLHFASGLVLDFSCVCCEYVQTFWQTLTLQRGVTSTARHSVNITCRGVTSPARHAARSHSFVYISTS